MSGCMSEVIREGIIYFIQTQDRGPSFPCIESLVYQGGRILSSRKIDYSQHLSDPRLQDIIRTNMHTLHDDLAREIAGGTYARI